MDKLDFLVQWDKDKTKTWSGTTWSLYNALQEYFNVNEVSLPNNRTMLRHILHYLGFGDNYLKEKIKHGVYADNIIGLKKTNVFQFGEILFDTSIRKTFIYQDLSVNYLYKIYRENKEFFIRSGFGKTSKNGLEACKDYELNYYQSCSGIFTMSNWLAKYLIEQLGLPAYKVHPVGGGINLDFSMIDVNHKQGNKILFVGRDFYRKGGDITIEAFKLLRKRMPEVELYIAGPKKCPKAVGVEGIYFVGPTSYRETADLFNKCDVFCMPSYFEAYGLVFIEALSFGLPVIGRRCCEMPYFIEEGKTGLMIEEDDPEILQNHMYTLLTDISYEQNVRKYLDFYKTQYSWAGVAERIANVIKG